MKILLILLLPLFLFSNSQALKLAFCSTKDNVNKDFLNLVIKVSEKMFKDKNLNVRIISLEPKEAVEKFRNNEIDLLATVSSVYIYNKEVFDKNYINRWILTINDSFSHQFYLLANRKNKNPFENLKQASISYPSGHEGSRIWIENLLYEKYKKPISSIVKENRVMAKENKILMDVFFGIKTLGVVTRTSFKTLVELSPNLLNKVKIIKKSKPIYIPIIGFAHKNIDKDKRDKFINIMQNVDNFLGNTDSSSTLKLDVVRSLNDKELNKLSKQYLKHKEFKEKYK